MKWIDIKKEQPKEYTQVIVYFPWELKAQRQNQ